MEPQEHSSNRPAEPSADAQENTPLLAQSQDDQQQYDATSVERQSNDANARHATYPTRFKLLFILFLTLLVLDIATLALKVAENALESYGSRNFGFYDYSTFDDGPIILMGLLGLFLVLANLARLRYSGRPVPPLINAIAYGVSAATFFTLAINTLSYRTYEGIPACRADLDDPETWYPGSLKECLEWRPKYVVVSWIYVVSALLYGLVALVATITTFVSVYRSRNESRNEGTATWTLPAGQLSVEVSFRWGPPSAQRADNSPERSLPSEAQPSASQV
ncbi:hypothetical protein HJFPF1_07385 [Paramyrothecium foliicola]|nr:hypothetical protein HJFPF1_07385 [Paramyrothecium foliicola]